MHAKTLAMAAGALALAALAAAPAHAATVNVNFVKTGQGQSVKITFGSKTMDVFAGQLIHHLSNGTGFASILSGDYVTFCTDLHEYVSKPTKVYDVVGVQDIPGPLGMGPDKAAAIHDLYRYANGSQLLGTTSNDFGAAFQIAIWEIVTDYSASFGRSTMSVTDGGFKAKKTSGASLSSSVLNHLNNLFNSVGSFPDDGQGPDIWGIRNAGAQDQIILAPLPTAGLLGIGGMAALAGLRRRRTVA